MIKFKCGQCDEVLVMDAQYSGSEVECPSCGAHVTVPAVKAQTFKRQKKKKGERKVTIITSIVALIVVALFGVWLVREQAYGRADRKFSELEEGTRSLMLTLENEVDSTDFALSQSYQHKVWKLVLDVETEAKVNVAVIGAKKRQGKASKHEERALELNQEVSKWASELKSDIEKWQAASKAQSER